MTSMRPCLGASNSKCVLLPCCDAEGAFSVWRLAGAEWISVLLVLSIEAPGRSSWCPLPCYCPSLRQPELCPAQIHQGDQGFLPCAVWPSCGLCCAVWSVPVACLGSAVNIACGRKEGVRLKPLIKGCLVWAGQCLKHSCHGITAPGCCSLSHAPLCCAGVPGCPCREGDTKVWWLTHQRARSIAAAPMSSTGKQIMASR